MKTQIIISLVATVFSASATQADELKAVTICSGAATLNNGSIITIGQPFVGVMSAPPGVQLNAGILPVFGMLSDLQLRQPAISPGAQMQGSVFQFSFQSQPGRNYVVEASTNLSSWLPIWTNTGSGASLLFEDAQAGQHPWRFYRLLTP
jgi:hypothetical protein